MLSSLRNTVEEPDHVYHSISSRPPFELGDWLASLSLLQYQNNFQDCGIETMKDCMLLDDNVLVEFGMKISDRRKLQIAIQKLYTF